MTVNPAASKNNRSANADNMSKKDAAKQTHSETITPLSVSTRPKGLDQVRPQGRFRFGIIFLIVSFVLLVGTGVWLLNFLSKNPLQPPTVSHKPPVQKPEPPSTTVSGQPQAPIKPAGDPEQLARDKLRAEENLADFMETKAGLDRKGAADWATDAYATIIDIARQADDLLIKEDYKNAADTYDRAINMARQLAGRTADVLQHMLEEGQAALVVGQGDVARNKFGLALKIDPDNQAAKKGLNRSQTIAEVHQLIESGKRLEENNALLQAQDEYQKAIKIDPDADSARQASQRVSVLIKDQQFRQLLSAGLTAYHNNDYALARERLLKAKSIKPSARDVSQALFEVDQAIRLARIDQLHKSAQRAESAEDWQTALRSYQAVLAIDPNLKFAVYGKERVGDQIRVAKRLDFYLTKPQVLESDEHLKNATLLLEEAREVEPQSRSLTSRISRLTDLVITAQTPVVVIIESDNLTQIAVYRVGKLGRFSQRKLKLRPGTYTVVGARDGYQDVRRKIVVKPGEQALRVTVACRVKI